MGESSRIRLLELRKIVFHPDYLLIYVAGERIDIPDSNLFFYTLDGGGDESKKHWFMKISNHEPSKFLEYDGLTPTV